MKSFFQCWMIVVVTLVVWSGGAGTALAQEPLEPPPEPAAGEAAVTPPELDAPPDGTPAAPDGPGPSPDELRAGSAYREPSFNEPRRARPKWSIPWTLELGGGVGFYTGELDDDGPGGIFRGALRLGFRDVDFGVWFLRGEQGLTRPRELSPVEMTGFGADLRLKVPLRDKAFALLYLGVGVLETSGPQPGAWEDWIHTDYYTDYSMRFSTPWVELGLGLEYRLARRLRWNVVLMYGARVRDPDSGSYFETRSHNHFFMTSSITLDFSGQ